MVNITGVCQLFVCHIYLDEKGRSEGFGKGRSFECELFSLFITKHLISWLCTQFLYFFFNCTLILIQVYLYSAFYDTIVAKRFTGN